MSKSYVNTTAKGRDLLAAAIRQELDVRGWTQAYAASQGGQLSQGTISKFLRKDDGQPYEATLSALDATFGWEPGFSRATITHRQNGAVEKLAEFAKAFAPEPTTEDEQDAIMTGDSELDAELRAIVDIRYILDDLDPPVRRRVIHWAAERYSA